MKKVISFILLIAFVTSSFFLFQYGKTKKMHEVVPGAIEDNVWCMSVAISDLCYNLNEGYVYYSDVCDKLNEMGMTKYEKYLEPLNLTFGENICDPALMNKALKEASSLNIDKSYRSLLRKHVVPIRATDVGYANFFKWSYQLFGIQVSSPYYFFFILFALGGLVYIIGFFANPICLILPLFFNGVFYFCMKCMGECDPIFNFRTLTFLAMVPTAHIIMSIILPQGIVKRTHLILIGIQALLICFVITVRSSSMWMMVAITLPCIQKAAEFLYQQRKDNPSQKVKDIIFGKILEYKYIVILLSIPVLAALYFKSYKTIMACASFGFSLMKRGHLSWNDFVLASVMLGASMICLLYFFSESFKSKKSSLKLFNVALVWTFLFIVPIFVFCLKEHPEFLKVSYRWFRASSLAIFLGSVVFLFYTYKGLQLKYPATKFHIINLKQYFLENRYAPALIAFMMLFSYKAFSAYEYHPAYYLNDCMPHHLVYHNAFIGLSSHPKLYRDIFENGKPGLDTVSWCAARSYFARSEEKKSRPFSVLKYDSPFTTDVKMKLHDKNIRAVYLKFIFKHPILTIQAHLYKIKNMAVATKNLIAVSKNFYFYSGLTLLLVFAALRGLGIQSLMGLRALSQVTFYMGLGSILPYIYAMNQYGHEDFGIIVVAAIYFGALFISYKLITQEKVTQSVVIEAS